MIYDSLKNLSLYGSGELWQSICEMVLGLNIDTPEGEYSIQSDIAFCRVMQFETKLEKDCRIEGHRRFIDIQLTIAGAEQIDIFQLDSVAEETPYDETNDVMFYTSQNAPMISTINHAGFFTFLWPHDLHRPQRAVESYKDVKKAVVKLDVNAFLHSRGGK
ncbi:YhcH/YjgK/YiaL family protein [Desulfovibrio inopinatus]|uniref:YhcH/YjgK/YiaL family protein n=1 Tax=Desulfovibrio inopinatus TaxID=102109 RepID=UPI00040C8F10|nr:YhcH/YjgK/YiaL family protein [Desulfovibrio inopinatus]